MSVVFCLAKKNALWTPLSCHSAGREWINLYRSAPILSFTIQLHTYIHIQRHANTNIHTDTHTRAQKHRINIFYRYLEASPPGCCPLCLLVWAKSGCGRKIWEKSQQIVWEESGTRSGGWEVWATCGGAGLAGGSTPFSLCCKQKLYINGIIN